MGIGESTPRRVTVENEGQDTIGVVKISESLLQGQQSDPAKSSDKPSQDEIKNLWQNLLNQKRELDYQQEKIDELLQDAFEQGKNIEAESRKGSFGFADENLRKRIQDKEQEIDEMRKNTRIFEEEQLKKSAEMEKSTMNEFNHAIEDVQKKFSDRKVGPVCTSLQNHVLDCYQENPHKSLKCSQLIQAYVDCVEQARKSVQKTVKTAN